MLLKTLVSQSDRRSFGVPLRLVLVIPFVVQIFAAVGLTGWISSRNGQKAVNDLAARLMQEVTLRIEQRIAVFADTPHLFLQINEAAIRTGNLDLANFSTIERYFRHQVQLHEFVTSFYFGSEAGHFLMLNVERDNLLYILDESSAPLRKIYRLNERGDRVELMQSAEYDPRERPWYRVAVREGKPTWSPIYVFAASPILGITPVLPIYNEMGMLRGVLAVDFTLSQISDFLGSLEISQSGEAFIIERSGEIVASSANEPPFVATAQERRRLLATDSSNFLIRSTARYLQERFGSFDRLENKQLLNVKFDQQRQFVRVTSIQDGRGLDWLMVVVIPETDFAEQIYVHTRIATLLCLVALALAIWLGLITSRWISRPILQLSEASRAIASGQLDRGVAVTSVKELGVLADSFNRMAGQLCSHFQQLEDYSRSQGQIVERRTEQLQQEIRDRQLLEEKLHTSESKMRAFFEAMTNIVLVLDNRGNIEVAPTNPTFLSDLNADIIGLTVEQFFLDEKADTWWGYVRQVLDTEQAITFDYRLPVGERQLWFSARISPISKSSAIWVSREISDRKQAELALQIAQQKSEKLLLNILPKPIADRLKQDTKAIANHFDEVTILFSDIVGFTPMSDRLSPIELVNLLNRMFSLFDQLAQKHGLEKIKTIGDAYMVAGGLPIPQPNRAEAIADMALEMQTLMKQFNADINDSLQIRIGINSGPVVAGVIGIKKFSYDLWGDTVNVASRMESSGLPGKIQVSADTYEILKDKYVFEKRGAIAVKGKGKMMTYWLSGKKN